MPRKKYHKVLSPLEKAQSDIKTIENQLSDNESSIIKKDNALHELNKEAEVLKNVQKQFEERRTQANTQREKAISERNKDIETFNEYMEQAKNELAEEIRQTKLINGQKPKTQIPLIAEYDKLKGDAKKKAAEDILSVLETRDGTDSLSEYFKNKQTIEADVEFLERDSHSNSNAKHKTRENIRLAVMEYNAAHTYDKINYNTFKALDELAVKNIDEFKSVSGKINTAISESKKLDDVTKKTAKEYLERYESYRTLNTEQQKAEKSAEAEINRLIGIENASRKSAENVFKGNIPSISDLDKLKGQMRTDSSREKLVELYQISINDALRDKRKSEGSTRGASNVTKEQDNYQTIQDYYIEADTIRVKNRELHFNDKDGEFHNKRDAIKNIIKSYNALPISENKKLPEKFADLTSLNDKDPVAYNNKAETIMDLIAASGNKDLEEYFKNFDYVKKGQDRLKRGRAFIDDAIKSQNVKLAKSKKEFDAELQKTKAIESKYGGELNASGSANYFIKLNEISRNMEEDFNKDLASAKSNMQKAKLKKGLLKICGDVVDEVTDLTKECAITLCLSQIKGELREKENNINNLKEEIKKREQVVKAVKRANSETNSKVARDIATGKAVIERESNAYAIDSSDINVKLVGNAQRSSTAKIAQQQLDVMKEQLMKAEKEYADLTQQKKEQAKELLLSTFGEKGEINADSRDLQNVDAEAERVFNLVNQIENEVSKKIDTHLIDIDSAQEQINKNYQFGKAARNEAETIAQNRENAAGANTAERMSDKISKLFTESNLKNVDSLVSVVETAFNKIRSFTGDDNKEDSKDDINVNDTLNSLKEKIDELNNPGTEKEHTLNKLVDAIKGFSDYLETTDKSVKNSIDKASSDYEMAAVVYDCRKKEAEELEKFKKEFAKKDENSKSPDYIYNCAKHILNADETEIEKHNENIRLIEACIKKTDDMAKDVNEKISKIKNEKEEYIKNKSALEARLKTKKSEIEELENALHNEKNNKMDKGEKKKNVRRIKLDDALKLSANGSKKSVGKTKAVSASKEQKPIEKNIY